MKKIFLPIAVVMTMLFSACSSNEPLIDDTTDKCWEYTVSTLGVTSPPDYFWGTAKEFGEIKSYTESMGMGYITITYRSVDKSSSQCYDLELE